MLAQSFPAVALALSLLTSVAAQSTDATCLPFYQWTFNSHKQSPCQVASTLIAVCGGSYNVAALPDQTHYLGPSLDLATPCQCNTVVYSLMSACGACQGRTYESWSAWSGNCPTVSINSFPQPIPPKTFVPGWAFLDVKANDMFEQANAKQNANITESTAAPSATNTDTSTSTSTSITSTSIISATTSTTFLASSPSSPVTTADSASTSETAAASLESHANAVVGGIVGGAMGLTLILGFAYWYISRRKRIAESGIQLHSPIEESRPLETADMRQYLANTAPVQASSSMNTSLPSPTSAQFSGGSGSIRSMGRSNV